MTLMGRWVDFVERRYRRILLASLVLGVVSATSLLRLRLDLDVLSMLPAGAPAFDNFKTFMAEFGELDELVILLQSDNPAALQSFADAFVERLRGLDRVTSVQGKIDTAQIIDGLLARYPYHFLAAQDLEQLQKQLTPASIDAQVAGLRNALQAPLDLSSAQWVQRDPLGFLRAAARSIEATTGDRRMNVRGGYLSSSDGSAVLLMVHPKQNAFDIPFTTAFMSEVRAAEAAVRNGSSDAATVQVGYTGSYAFAMEDAATIKADVARYTLLALLGVLAVFVVAYRNLRILPFVTYPLVLCTLVSFMISLLIYDRLNAVSTSFAAILYGLSIDSAVHYYNRLLQELRNARNLRDAVEATLSKLGGASTVASLTTAAAFLVISFSKLAGISELGAMTAIGMLVNVVCFFVLYPALTFWVPQGALAELHTDMPVLGRLADWSVRHARSVLLCTVVLCALLLAVASRVSFDVDLTRLRPSQGQAAAVQDAIVKRFGDAAQTGALLVRAADVEHALRDSETLAARLQELRAQGLISNISGVTGIAPSQQTQNERLARFAAWQRAEVAAALRAALQRHGFRAESFQTFLENFERPVADTFKPGDAALAPFAPLLDRYIRRQDGTATVATYIVTPPPVRFADIGERLQHELPNVRLIPAARSWMEEELARLLRHELLAFCIAAFFLNALLVWANFRRLSLTAAILVPQAVVVIAFFAIVAVGSAGIDPVSMIVVPLILGIGVDNCVYVAERLQGGATAGEALRLGGRALLVASFTTMVGFGFLGLSRYPALANMGILTAGCLFLCLLGSIILLPALLPRAAQPR